MTPTGWLAIHAQQQQAGGRRAGMITYATLLTSAAIGQVWCVGQSRLAVCSRSRWAHLRLYGVPAAPRRCRPAQSPCPARTHPPAPACIPGLALPSSSCAAAACCTDARAAAAAAGRVAPQQQPGWGSITSRPDVDGRAARGRAAAAARLRPRAHLLGLTGCHVKGGLGPSIDSWSLRI